MDLPGLEAGRVIRIELTVVAGQSHLVGPEADQVLRAEASGVTLKAQFIEPLGHGVVHRPVAVEAPNRRARPGPGGAQDTAHQTRASASPDLPILKEADGDRPTPGDEQAMRPDLDRQDQAGEVLGNPGGGFPIHETPRFQDVRSQIEGLQGNQGGFRARIHGVSSSLAENVAWAGFGTLREDPG